MEARSVSRTTELSYKGAPWTMATCLVLLFATYGRPCDVLPLKRRQLCPPAPSAGPAHRHWMVVLHPAEGPTRSKTHEADESLVMDNPEFDFVAPVLSVLRQDGSEAEVFPFGYTELAREAGTALRRLGYGKLGVASLYQLRHGGPLTRPPPGGA